MTRLALTALLVLSAGCGVVDTIRFAFHERGAPPTVQDQAVRVARCESGLAPEARNGVHVGLFQLSLRYHSARIHGDWTDPYTNAAAAADLWAEQGWRPWTCKP